MVRQVFVVQSSPSLDNQSFPAIAEAIRNSGILGDNGYITKIKIYDNQRLCQSYYNYNNTMSYMKTIMFELECDQIIIDEFVPGNACLIKSGNNTGRIGKITKIEENGKVRVIVDNGDNRLYAKEHLDSPYKHQPNPIVMSQKLNFDGNLFNIWFRPVGYEIFYNDTIVEDGITISIFDLNSGLNPKTLFLEKYNWCKMSDFVGEWTPQKVTKGAKATLLS